MDNLDDLLLGVASEVKGEIAGVSPGKKGRYRKGKDKDENSSIKALTILNSQAILGMYARIRDMESVCFDFFQIPSSNVICVAAKACAVKIAETRKTHRIQSKTWKLDYPIHIAIWTAVLQEWAKSLPDANPHKALINDYLKAASADKTNTIRKQMAMEIPYWRRLDMYDKDNTKLIINCRAAGTTTYEIWQIMMAYIVSPAGQGKRLLGVAPRNAKERKIAKFLDSMQGKRPSELIAAMDDSDDEPLK